MAAAPLVEPLVAARWRTQSLAAALLVALSLAAAIVAPISAMVLGPLLLGAPHLIGDLRVLCLQRPADIDDRTIARILIPLIAMTMVRLLGNSIPSPAEVEVLLGVTAVVIASHCGQSSQRVRRWMLATMLPLVVVAVAFAPAVQLTLAHAHNVVAFLAWMAWTRCTRGAFCVAVVYVAAWLVVIALPMSEGELAAGAFGATASTFSSGLAPGVDPTHGALVVRSFVFAQLVHYGIWTFALPRVDAARERRLPRMAWIAIVAGCALVPIAGAFDALRVRGAYLSLVVFHGWFELAVFAFVAVRRLDGRSR